MAMKTPYAHQVPPLNASRLARLITRFCLILLLAGPSSAMAQQASEGPSPGERIYREGLLPSGEPLTAIVAGDIPVDGRMFSCVNCHRRSGLGSVEGSLITWPTTGKELFGPRRRTGAWHAAAERKGPGAVERWSLPPQYQAADARPAYTEESLARLLREGIDSAGRVVSRAMPRFDIADDDLRILIDYLKGLSSAIDEGVNDQSIRFATVITDGVPENDRRAMLEVLQAHIDARNTQTRPYLRRATSGPFYKTEKFTAYRKFELDVWELEGDAGTWRQQLEKHYSEAPVFAMLGGIADGSWQPIHDFCESRELPCLLPITEQPVVSDTDWYTLYFSRGLHEEGETAARFLNGRHEGERKRRVVQFYRPGSAGAQAAAAFSQHWSGDIVDESLPPKSGDAVDTGWLEKVSGENDSILLLWLDESDLAPALERLETSNTEDGPPLMISATLAGDAGLAGIPRALRERLFITYPRSLAADSQTERMVLRRWLKARGIEETNLDIQARMYFLGWVLPGAISYMRSEVYRDYFLEGFEMMRDQDYAIAVYPRLSFGPGQRYASKGCYIVQLDDGEEPRLVKRSNWIIH